MVYLMRVELPDVPGSLGALATALGTAGADIQAIEIVEHRPDGKALDDVLLDLPVSAMPDEVITACQALEGVRVHWITRYNAGMNLHMDLEAIESFTEDPANALAHLAEVIPGTLRTDWAMVISGGGGEVECVSFSPSAPALVPDAKSWLEIADPAWLTDVDDWPEMLLAAAPFTDRNNKKYVMVVGRYGGPEFLPSELARLGLMGSLAGSVFVA